MTPMTPEAIANQLEYLAKRLRNGCGDGNCQIKIPAGMHTNASCVCDPTRFASQLLGLSLACEEHGRRWQKTEETRP
jgi:hypothetical protein